jgi:hypothetical protein
LAIIERVEKTNQMQQQKVEGELSALGFWSNSKNSMISNPPKKSLKEPIFFLRGDIK